MPPRPSKEMTRYRSPIMLPGAKPRDGVVAVCRAVPLPSSEEIDMVGDSFSGALHRSHASADSEFSVAQIWQRGIVHPVNVGRDDSTGSLLVKRRGFYLY